MAAIFQQHRSTTATNVPALGSLAEGQLAVNIADQKLWVGDTAGDPVRLDSEWFSDGDIQYNTNTGNTGIGTTTPATTLDVTGVTRTGSNEHFVWTYQFSDSSAYVVGADSTGPFGGGDWVPLSIIGKGLFLTSSEDGVLKLQTNGTTTDDYIAFNTGGSATQRMRIDKDGGVWVGNVPSGLGFGTINVSGGYYVNGSPAALLSDVQALNDRLTLLEAAAALNGWVL